MELHDEVLEALRHAVELSPDSGPLRRHYAEMLLNRGYARQAEEEFRKAIDLDHLDAPSKLGLARALHSQNQNSTALLLVKQVIRDSDRPAKAYILYARLLLALGSVERAAREYRRAIAKDPEAVDPDLASELGLATAVIPPGSPEHPAVMAARAAGAGKTAAARATGSTEGRRGSRAMPPRSAASALSTASSESSGSKPGRGTPGLGAPGLEDTNPSPMAPPADDSFDSAEAPDPNISPTEAYTHRLRRLFASQPRITFDEVSGLDGVKRELNAMLVHPLNHRDYYRAYDKRLGGRVLLYGPPGCGKTYLARAVAGEVLAPFLAVHIHDLMDQWQQHAGGMLREIFEQARDMSPSVLFFDDVETAGTLSPVSRQLNRELTGEDNEGLMILAATNAPWDADPALLNPGRFDRVLFVRPPSRADRLEALRRLCQGKPQEELKLPELASWTSGMTFGDLSRLVDLALDAVLQASLERGNPQPLTAQALMEAARRISASAPPWLEEAREILRSTRGPADVYDELEEYLASEDS
ncbi:MAG: AAA family ATPase [Acidobacteriota bacterium]|nr:AAA family ATPase [Acidobacteriota bacterium]